MEASCGGSLASDAVMKLVTLDDIQKAPMFDAQMTQQGGALWNDLTSFLTKSFDTTKTFVSGRITFLRSKLNQGATAIKDGAVGLKKRVWGGEEDDAAVDEFMRKFTEEVDLGSDTEPDASGPAPLQADSESEWSDTQSESTDLSELSDSELSDTDDDDDDDQSGGGGWLPSSEYQTYATNQRERPMAVPDDGATGYLYRHAL